MNERHETRVIRSRYSYDEGALSPAFHCVGRYMYYFGQLELALADVICVLLNLDENAARLLLPQVYFAAKIDIIEEAIPHQQQDKRWQKKAVDLVNDCRRFINERNMICHGAFSLDSLESGNVAFEYVTRKGKPPSLAVWSEQYFAQRCEELERLQREVDSLYPGFRQTNYAISIQPASIPIRGQ